MLDTAIEVSNLSKQYRLGAASGTDRLAGLAAGGVTALAARLRRRRRLTGAEREFWALRDVSFAVRPGEVVGLIGANGSGKSTLLKILSRITDPTAGMARVRGRVSSLLEVGTGFHPELSGRDNIYLNGAILGMRRAEIQRKFDQIVAFAEIDRFLDTPVKRYSSGMYVRLAFAVAAHLEPEILVIDEVLAVGDAAFQAKCLGKMDEVAQTGRTILFVSHHMAPIRQLCSRAILLDRGRVAADGPSTEVVDQYLRGMMAPDSASGVAQQIATLPPDPAIRFFDVNVGQDGEAGHYFVTGRPTRVRVEYEILQDTYGLRVFVLLQDFDGTPLFRSFCGSDQPVLPVTKAGRYVSEAVIPADLLAPIKYQVGVSASIFNLRHCTARPIYVPITVHDAGRIKNAYALSTPISLKLAPIIPWTTKDAGRRDERARNRWTAVALDTGRRGSAEEKETTATTVAPTVHTPTVSVLMPVYNVAAYLPQAIDSILRQNWSDFELIAVDDGSTDHTLAILRQYARRDPRVRVISRPNTGIAGALNDGLAAARGRYLARMDGDDICAPDRLALQLAFLEAHPSCAAVGTAMQTIDPAGLPIAIVNPPLDHTHIDAQHLRGDGGAIAHPTAMFRTATLRSVGGYRPQYNFVEDLDLFLRLAERGQLANLPQILYSYRTHLLSQTHLVGTCFTKRDRQTVLIEQLLLETYKRRGLPGSPDLVQLRLSRSEPQQDAVTTVRWWALHALQLGNLPAARRHAWMLLRRRPASLDAWRIAYWSLAG